MPYTLFPTPAETRQPTLKAQLGAWLDQPWVERGIIAVIVANAITLGLDTSSNVRSAIGSLLDVLDVVFMIVFVVELAIRLYARGAGFWRDPWSVFDFLVVAVTLAPQTGNLSILRALRILRAMRLVSAVPSIRKVVGSLLAAIPGMTSIIVLLVLINYVFAVMATRLFGADFPELFGTLGASFFTFFQIMTLEGWAGDIVRPVMDKHPWSWLLFVPYIVVVTFAVLNLFIGIIVDAMQQETEVAVEELTRDQQLDHREVMREIRALRAEVATLTDAHRQGRSDAQGAE